MKILLTLLLLIPCLSIHADSKISKVESKKLTIYSSRNEDLLKPIIDLYTKKTGVKFELLTGKAGALTSRIKAEGKHSPADLFMTVDAGNLWFAAKQEILAPIKSKILDSNISSKYRGMNSMWYGISLRARTIVYNPMKVKASDLKSYVDLAHPKWKNKLCLRTSAKVYNRSLVAELIAQNNEKATIKTTKGWANNLAQKVFKNDTLMIKSIANPTSGCQVGIANTYYLGRLVKKDLKYPVKVFWPKKEDGGVHVNVSGISLVKSSKNKDLATKFIEWLSQPEAQQMFADLNMEYPIHPEVSPSTLIKAWGDFEVSKISLAKIGELQPQAMKVIAISGYK